MKTRKSVSSRFRVTGTGKLKMSKPGKRHLMAGKAPKRKRQLRRPGFVSDDKLKTIKRLMCI